MTNTISQVYGILKGYRKIIPEAECISLFMFDDSFRIRVDWLKEDKLISYVASYSYVELDTLHDFDDMDSVLFDKVKSAFSLWEIGEE